MIKSPYQDLPSRAYWRSGVTERHPLSPGDIYIKKFAISDADRIATAGSCFAQHIANQMRTHGYNVLDTEPAPPGLGLKRSKDYGFNLYSARFGNIYTVRQLTQLIRESEGARSPMVGVWEREGRFFDALRPSVEPGGLPSPEEVQAHRRQHLSRVGHMLRSATVFVFTMGLTEAWVHSEDGTVYPTAPGTIAGSYDEASYVFKNFTYGEVIEDFLEVRRILRAKTPGIRFLLTVSPVPLTATASSEHVLPATMYSKSVLRAVAGELSATYSDVDYFPSYEIIAGVPARGFFYEANLRSVSTEGVAVVMKSFFSQHRLDRGSSIHPNSPISAVETPEPGGVMCEEELLEAFA